MQTDGKLEVLPRVVFTDWMENRGYENLADALYDELQEKPLEVVSRGVFIKGTMEDNLCFTVHETSDSPVKSAWWAFVITGSPSGMLPTTQVGTA